MVHSRLFQTSDTDHRITGTQSKTGGKEKDNEGIPLRNGQMDTEEYVIPGAQLSQPHG